MLWTQVVWIFWVILIGFGNLTSNTLKFSWSRADFSQVFIILNITCHSSKSFPGIYFRLISKFKCRLVFTCRKRRIKLLTSRRVVGYTLFYKKRKQMDDLELYSNEDFKAKPLENWVLLMLKLWKQILRLFLIYKGVFRTLSNRFIFTKAYSEPCQTALYLAVNCFRKTLNLDFWQVFKYSSDLRETRLKKQPLRKV